MSNLNSKILVDQVGTVKLSLTEGKEDKRLYAEGKVGQCDIPTANGRIYTRPVMQREINKLQERIQSGSLFCAVDHPGDGKGRISDVGAIVRKLWIENDGAVYGKFEIIEEGVGKQLGAIIRSGGVPGMSSRGMGSTSMDEQGREVVGEDFRLVTYDFVSDPAVSTAYPRFFTESVDDLNAVTVDMLKAKFPKQVREITEAAHELAKETTLEVCRSDMERDVEAALEKSKDTLKENLKIELYSQIVSEMRDDYASKLIKSLQAMRKEVEESVRSELKSDPSVAGAKLTLEQVAKLVNPFTPTTDVKGLLGEKELTLKVKSNELDEQKQTVEKFKAKLAMTEATARKLGFQLYVEKVLSGREDADSIKESLGPVDNFNSVEQLQEKLANTIKHADMQTQLAESKAQARLELDKKLYEKRLELSKQRADKAEADKAQLAEAINTKVQSLSEKLSMLAEAKDKEIVEKANALAEANSKIKYLEESVNKAVMIAENLKYASERSKGHPKQNEILESIAAGRTKSRKDVDELSEDLETRAEEPGGVGERVRRLMSKGREVLKESERKQKQLSENRTPIPGLEDSGLSLEEIRNLSGL